MESGYAPEKIEYGVNRYVNETRRLYRTLDTHLATSSSGFIVGDRVTIADISIWGWVSSASTSFLPIPFPYHLRAMLTCKQNGPALIWRSSPTSRSGCTSSSSARASRRAATCPRRTLPSSSPS